MDNSVYWPPCCNRTPSEVVPGEVSSQCMRSGGIIASAFSPAPSGPTSRCRWHYVLNKHWEHPKREKCDHKRLACSLDVWQGTGLTNQQSRLLPWLWWSDGIAISKPPSWSSCSLGSSLGLGAFYSSAAAVSGPSASHRSNLRFSSKGRSSSDPPDPAIPGHSAGCWGHSVVTCPRVGELSAMETPLYVRCLS